LRGRQKLPHPAAEPVSLHDSEIAADEVVDQVPMSTHGTKRQFARCKAMSGVGGKADLPVERPDFSF
jgi:hypothetical protein